MESCSYDDKVLDLRRKGGNEDGEWEALIDQLDRVQIE